MRAIITPAIVAAFVVCIAAHVADAQQQQPSPVTGGMPPPACRADSDPYDFSCNCHRDLCHCLGGNETRSVNGTGMDCVVSPGSRYNCTAQRRCVELHSRCIMRERLNQSQPQICATSYYMEGLQLLAHAATDPQNSSIFTSRCSARLCNIQAAAMCAEANVTASDHMRNQSCIEGANDAARNNTNTSVPPAPPPPPCDCHGRGTVYQAPWAEKGCYCSCNWPFGGNDCSSCAVGTDYFDATTATCRPCFGPEYSSYDYASRPVLTVPSGGTAAFPLTINPLCLAGRQVMYYGGNPQQQWTPTYAPVASGGVLVMQHCSNRENAWFPFTQPLYLTGTYSWAYLGQVNCAPPLLFGDLTTPFPTRVHLHLNDATTSSAALVVSIAHRLLLANGTDVVITDYRNASAPPMMWRGAAAVAGMLMYVNNVTSKAPAAPQCGLHLSNPTTMSTSNASSSSSSSLAARVMLNVTHVVIVGGSVSCTVAADDLANVARRRVRIAVVSQFAPSQLRFVTAIAVEQQNPWSIEAPLTAFFASAFGAEATCSPQVTFPSMVDGRVRRAVPVVGACNVSACTFGTQASRFVDNTGAVSACVTPLLSEFNGNRTVSVAIQTSVGSRGASTRVRAPELWKLGVYTYRMRTWDGRNFDGFWQSRGMYLPMVWASRYMSGDICCRWVGVTFDDRVAGAFGASNSTACFPAGYNYGYYTYSSLELAVPAMPQPVMDGNTTLAHFGAPIQTVALQCGERMVADPTVVDGVSYNVSAAGNTSVTGVAALPSAATPVNRQRQNTYIAHALAAARATTSAGMAMKHVRQALAAAGLVSTIAPHRRPCGPNDIPTASGICEFAWSATAAGAAPHLVSAGFTEVATGWLMGDVQRGDVLVLPAVSYVVGGATQSIAEGLIAIRTAEGVSAAGWVGDVVHGDNMLPGLIPAAQANVTFQGGNPRLFRLVGVVEEHPMVSEAILPVPAALEVTADREAYCRAWNRKERESRPGLPSAINYVNRRFACPAVLDRFTRPREFGWTEMTGLGVGFDMQCFGVSSWWLSAQGWRESEGLGLRCCYDLQDRYIAQWPSAIQFINLMDWDWSATNENEAERVCCGAGANVTSQACLAFRDRRPAPEPTNAPFNPPMLWTPIRRRAGGWGDPHCSTYDGVNYECNFHGEAVWTACGNWTVHAVAEPVGNGSATAITKFAVRFNQSTIIGRLGAASNVSRRQFTITLDDDEVDRDVAGSEFSVSFLNNTVSIADMEGNEVTAVFSAQLITLSTLPAEACRGKTRGLSGNFNGNATDDLMIPGTSTLVNINATSDVIYRDFVVANLVTDQTKTLFPASMQIVTNTSYTPAFITTAVLASCPASCNSVQACCFDASVGGASFAQEFVQARQQLDASNQGAIAFNENFPPVFVQATNLIVINLSMPVATTAYASFTASDSNNVAALDCSVCSMTNVTCTRSGLGSGNATLTVTGPTPRTAGGFNCSAVDGLGARGVAATLIVAEGALSGGGFVVDVSPPPVNPNGTQPVGPTPTPTPTFELRPDAAVTTSVVATVLAAVMAIALY